ncbi:MAG: hypothetical protein IKS92_09685 [Victivallales bacterium]|nr:hypothetical protein [Victivallales bacterium]
MKHNSPIPDCHLQAATNDMSMWQLTRRLWLLAVSVLLCFLSSGCVLESAKDQFIGKCYTDTAIVERYGDFSNSKDTVSVSLKTSKIYHYEPFWRSSITTTKPLQTFTYSLTEPTADSELSKWIIVPDETAERRFVEIRLDIKDEDARYFKSTHWFSYDFWPNLTANDLPRHESPLILPICSFLKQEPLPKQTENKQDSKHKTASGNQRGAIAYHVHIHPDDIHYLTKPFLSRNDYRNPFKLQIPYKIEDGIFYMYSPKDSEKIFWPPNYDRKKNATRYAWGVIIPPVALALDIVLLPVEAVGVVVLAVLLAAGGV